MKEGRKEVEEEVCGVGFKTRDGALWARVVLRVGGGWWVRITLWYTAPHHTTSPLATGSMLDSRSLVQSSDIRPTNQTMS